MASLSCTIRHLWPCASMLCTLILDAVWFLWRLSQKTSFYPSAWTCAIWSPSGAMSPLSPRSWAEGGSGGRS